MPGNSISGVSTLRYLNDLKRAKKNNTAAQNAMSSGVLPDPSLNPTASAQGQNAKAKISAFQTAGLQAIEALAVCQSVNSAITSGLDLLTEQIEITTHANTDTNDNNIKRLLDASFQSALSAFETTMASVRWNDDSILSNTISHVTPLSKLGIYNETLALGSNSSAAFAFGAPNSNIKSFHGLIGTASGAVGAITASGNEISMQIGNQTFEIDITGMSLNSGDIIELTDNVNSQNKLTFELGDTGSNAINIANGIDSLLQNLTFNPNISNLTPVSGIFTGGINYNYTKGNYTGIPTGVSVKNIGNQLEVTVKISQSSQDQFFKATIPHPIAGAPLILTSLTNSQNSIAFNMDSNFTVPITAQDLENSLKVLLGVDASPSIFKGMSVDPYHGISIKANSSIQKGTYTLEYTLLQNGKAQFSLNSGAQSFQEEVSLPLREKDTINFSNGINLKLNDLTQFDESQSKGQMSFTVNQGTGDHILYFQTGIRSDEQVKIKMPTITLESLGLLGINVKSNENAVIAGNTLRDAIKTLTTQLGAMARTAQTIQTKYNYAQDLAIRYTSIHSESVGTDIPKSLVAATESEANIDIIFTALAKELKQMEKNTELLRQT